MPMICRHGAAGNSAAELLREAGHGLADHFQVTDTPHTHQLVPVESLTAAARVATDRLDGVEDVVETRVVPSHRATASCSTRSRKRGRMARAVTTST